LTTRKSIFRKIDRYAGIPVLFLLSFFAGRKELTAVKGVPKNILIIKFAAIGDTILLTTTLRILKKNFPDSKIYFLCSDINYKVVKNIKYVDEILNEDVHGFLKNPFKAIELIKKLRSLDFDVVIDAEQWSRISSILCLLTRKKTSIGFDTEKQFRNRAYDILVKHSREKHELEVFTDLLKPLNVNIETEDIFLEYPGVFEIDREFIDNFLIENKLTGKQIVCFQPGSGVSGAAREWKSENFIQLGKKIMQNFPDTAIVLTGAPNDRERCEFIADSINEKSISIAGKFPFEKELQIIKKSEFLVCCNTGILHIAASIGVRTIALHGPHNSKKWGAYDDKSVVVQSDIFCSPCLYLGHDFGCSKPQCMDRITIDDVFEKVMFLKKKKDL